MKETMKILQWRKYNKRTGKRRQKMVIKAEFKFLTIEGKSRSQENILQVRSVRERTIGVELVDQETWIL